MVTRRAMRAATAAPFVLVFNAFFFVLGGPRHNRAVWLSYGFVHLSYIVMLAALYGVPKGRSAALFGLTRAAISSAYFALALIAGSIYIVVAPDRYEAALLTQLLLLGVFVVFFVWAAASEVRTSAAEEERRLTNDYLKRALSEVASIASFIDDGKTKRSVEGVYGALLSSPVKSHPSVLPLEARILIAIGSLRELAGSGNWREIASRSEEVRELVSERQRQLNLLN